MSERPGIVANAQAAALWVGAAIVPAMLAEMMLPISTMTSLKVALVFLGLSAVAGCGMRAGWSLVVHLVAFSAFVLLGIQPSGWFDHSIVRAEVLNGLEALAVAPFLAAHIRGTDDLARFVRRTAVFMLVGALVGGSLGVVKLYFLTQGVFFNQLYASDGTYPLGTALGSDYNLYAFGIVAGVAAAFWLRGCRDRSAMMRVLLALAVVGLSAIAVLAGSRRGLVFLGLVLALQFFPSLSWPAVERRRGTAWFPTALVGALLVGLVYFAVHKDSIVLTIGGRPVNLTVIERLLTVRERQALVATRAPLVDYAVSEIDGNYSVAELMHGRGFRYLADMGRRFAAPDGVEYPHNFVLAAVLQGGLLFALLLMALVVAGGLAAWRRRQLLGPIPFVLVAATLFALSSSASIYSTELLVFLLVFIPLLPAHGAPAQETIA